MSDFELRERLTSRPDLADLDAYGAPQLDVAVRLNTNESPYPPPTAFMEDLAGRVAKLSLNRYPDRDFTALREGLARHVGTVTFQSGDTSKPSLSSVRRCSSCGTDRPITCSLRSGRSRTTGRGGSSPCTSTCPVNRAPARST